jgi:hypothetical protein
MIRNPDSGWEGAARLRRKLPGHPALSGTVSCAVRCLVREPGEIMKRGVQPSGELLPPDRARAWSRRAINGTGIDRTGRCPFFPLSAKSTSSTGKSYPSRFDRRPSDIP